MAEIYPQYNALNDKNSYNVILNEVYRDLIILTHKRVLISE